MTDINIPGDELDTASSNLQQVLQLFGDSTTSNENLEAALGNSNVLGTANDFESRWSYGRQLIKDDGQKLVDAINKINSTFTDIDNQLADNLSPNSGGTSS